MTTDDRRRHGERRGHPVHDLAERRGQRSSSRNSSGSVAASRSTSVAGSRTGVRRAGERGAAAAGVQASRHHSYRRRNPAGGTSAPPPQAMQSPDLQTEGRFDIEKYRRSSASPSARQSGMLAGSSSTTAPRSRSRSCSSRSRPTSTSPTTRLWQIYRDRTTPPQVSFVTAASDDADGHGRDGDGRGDLAPTTRATRSASSVPAARWSRWSRFRASVTAADTAAARARIERLRAEIVGRREVRGRGAARVDRQRLGRAGRLARHAARATASRRVRAGGVRAASRASSRSRCRRRSAGTSSASTRARATRSTLRHILVPHRTERLERTRTDRRADSLAKHGRQHRTTRRSSTRRRKVLGLTPRQRRRDREGAAHLAGRYVPSVSAWAFCGARVGETSDLFDAPDAYYVARLDSLHARRRSSRSTAVRDEITPSPRAREEAREAACRSRRQFAGSGARSGARGAPRQRRRARGREDADCSRASTLVPGLGQFTRGDRRRVHACPSARSARRS